MSRNTIDKYFNNFRDVILKKYQYIPCENDEITRGITCRAIGNLTMYSNTLNSQSYKKFKVEIGSNTGVICVEYAEIIDTFIDQYMTGNYEKGSFSRKQNNCNLEQMKKIIDEFFEYHESRVKKFEGIKDSLINKYIKESAFRWNHNKNADLIYKTLLNLLKTNKL
ncbi:MAG: hypothetical protein PHC34_02585 [Candidatus Gastranaerophilales bacterium]|nr:hypothetical protein [Candidatus Gastranaerophilales bacterium]